MKYVVRIGEEEIEVVIDGDAVLVAGTERTAVLESAPSSPLHVLKIAGEVHRVVAHRGAQRGQFTVWVAGHRFEVEALDERRRAIRKLTGAGKVAGPAHVMAPMPGLIVRVTVSEGDPVKAGQGVVVMEAMKMENELRAPAAGVVKRVLAKPGMAVEKGAMLLEMDADAS
jgi:pyruvate carboxylase subunit B